MSQTHTVRGTATSIRTENGQTVVRYHSTDVVRFDASTIQLDTGGWATATTKTRMNQTANQFGLDFKVWQTDGEWYVAVWIDGVQRQPVRFGNVATIYRSNGKIRSDVE